MNELELKEKIEQLEGKSCCVCWVPSGDYNMMRDLTCLVFGGKTYTVSRNDLMILVSVVKSEDVCIISSTTNTINGLLGVVASALLNGQKLENVTVELSVTYDGF